MCQYQAIEVRCKGKQKPIVNIWNLCFIFYRLLHTTRLLGSRLITITRNYNWYQQFACTNSHKLWKLTDLSLSLSKPVCSKAYPKIRLSRLWIDTRFVAESACIWRERDIYPHHLSNTALTTPSLPYMGKNNYLPPSPPPLSRPQWASNLRVMIDIERRLS